MDSGQVLNKAEAIKRVRIDAALDIARTVTRIPSPLGLLLAFHINERARARVHAIATYVEPDPSAVIETVQVQVKA